MCCLAEEHFRGFHQGLGQRRVRMDRQFEIGRVRPHFDRENTLSDKFACARTDQTHAEDSLRFRIEDELGQPIGAIERNSAA